MKVVAFNLGNGFFVFYESSGVNEIKFNASFAYNISRKLKSSQKKQPAKIS